MKFVCLGYFDDKKWEALSETEQKAFIEECFAMMGRWRKGGHIAGGEALEPPRNATTLQQTATRLSPTARTQKLRNRWAAS